MKDKTIVELLIIGSFVIPLVGWIVTSHLESKTYNKLTGAHTTTWDAMWVELRVQDNSKN